LALLVAARGETRRLCEAALVIPAAWWVAPDAAATQFGIKRDVVGGWAGESHANEGCDEGDRKLHDECKGWSEMMSLELKVE
jgi:hypothetical protein